MSKAPGYNSNSNGYVYVQPQYIQGNNPVVILNRPQGSGGTTTYARRKAPVGSYVARRQYQPPYTSYSKNPTQAPKLKATSTPYYPSSAPRQRPMVNPTLIPPTRLRKVHPSYAPYKSFSGLETTQDTREILTAPSPSEMQQQNRGMYYQTGDLMSELQALDGDVVEEEIPSDWDYQGMFGASLLSEFDDDGDIGNEEDILIDGEDEIEVGEEDEEPELDSQSKKKLAKRSAKKKQTPTKEGKKRKLVSSSNEDGDTNEEVERLSESSSGGVMDQKSEENKDDEKPNFFRTMPLKSFGRGKYPALTHQFVNGKDMICDKLPFSRSFFSNVHAVLFRNAVFEQLSINIKNSVLYKLDCMLGEEEFSELIESSPSPATLKGEIERRVFGEFFHEVEIGALRTTTIECLPGLYVALNKTSEYRRKHSDPFVRFLINSTKKIPEDKIGNRDFDDKDFVYGRLEVCGDYLVISVLSVLRRLEQNIVKIYVDALIPIVTNGWTETPSRQLNNYKSQESCLSSYTRNWVRRFGVPTSWPDMRKVRKHFPSINILNEPEIDAKFERKIRGNRNNTSESKGEVKGGEEVEEEKKKRNDTTSMLHEEDESKGIDEIKASISKDSEDVGSISSNDYPLLSEEVVFDAIFEFCPILKEIHPELLRTISQMAVRLWPQLCELVFEEEGNGEEGDGNDLDISSIQQSIKVLSKQFAGESMRLMREDLRYYIYNGGTLEMLVDGFEVTDQDLIQTPRTVHQKKQNKFLVSHDFTRIRELLRKFNGYWQCNKKNKAAQLSADNYGVYLDFKAIPRLLLSEYFLLFRGLTVRMELFSADEAKIVFPNLSPPKLRYGVLDFSSKGGSVNNISQSTNLGGEGITKIRANSSSSTCSSFEGDHGGMSQEEYYMLVESISQNVMGQLQGYVQLMVKKSLDDRLGILGNEVDEMVMDSNVVIMVDPEGSHQQNETNLIVGEDQEVDVGVEELQEVEEEELNETIGTLVDEIVSDSFLVVSEKEDIETSEEENSDSKQEEEEENCEKLIIDSILTSILDTIESNA